MHEFAQAILLMVRIWATPAGEAVYAPHFRGAHGGPEARALQLAEDFAFAERAYGIDRHMLAALAYRESGFNPYATGKQNEFSIMQLHPRSAVGRETARFCRAHPGCERAAILAAAHVLADGYAKCGTEAAALGFYRTGRCVSGPGAQRVLETRARILAALPTPPVRMTLQ